VHIEAAHVSLQGAGQPSEQIAAGDVLTLLTAADRPVGDPDHRSQLLLAVANGLAALTDPIGDQDHPGQTCTSGLTASSRVSDTRSSVASRPDIRDHAVVDTFGERLKAAMALRGMTSQGLAHAMNTHEKNVERWRRAKHHPQLGNLIAIADALKVSLDYLTGRSEDPGVAVTSPNGAGRPMPPGPALDDLPRAEGVEPPGQTNFPQESPPPGRRRRAG
jgi:transcriptional regulator with XRE-family HTH domain